MLDSRYLSGLSPLAQHFRAKFFEQFPSLAAVEEFTDRYELVIPPAHVDVGELRVRDDTDELTISLGPYHHWHEFLYRFENEPEAKRVQLTAESAVESIRSILEHRTILRITRRDGRVVSTETYTIDYDRVTPAMADDEEFVWTGPRGGLA